MTAENSEHMVSLEFNTRKLHIKDYNGRITFSIQIIF